MPSQSVDQSSGEMGHGDNHLVPSTPAKSPCRRPNSHFYDQSSILLNETATEGASFANSIRDQDSEAKNTVTRPLSLCVDFNAKPAELLPSFGISTPAKPVPVRPIISPPLDGDLEIAIENPIIHNQESATAGSLPQCFDLNAPPTEPHNSTLAPKGGKRKAHEQDDVATPENRPKMKKKKVYWPKVKGQIKRRPTPKVPKECKTNKRTPISTMDGGAAAKPKRTTKSIPAKSASKVAEGKFDMSCYEKQPSDDIHKVQVELLSTPKVLGQIMLDRTPKSMSIKSTSKVDEGKFGMSSSEVQPSDDIHEIQVKLLSTPKILEQLMMEQRTPSLPKRQSCKRSLVFELEDEAPHMHNGLSELGCKGNSVQLSRKKIAQKRINLTCPQLTRVRKMKLKFPKACLRKRVRKWKLPFQLIEKLFAKKRLRSKNCKGRIILDALVVCNPTSLSKQGVEEEKKEKHGIEERRGFTSMWKTKRKRGMRRKKKMKDGTTNLAIDRIPKQEFGKWEIRDGIKALCTKSKFVEYPLEENNGEEEKGTRKRNRKIISSGVMKILINSFQSLHINYRNNELVPYKSQDGRLIPYKGTKEGPRIKVKINIDPETLRVWNLLMDGKSPHEDEENGEYWEKERSIYLGRVTAFIARMHNFLGNRRFSPWKGSVLDSVIGVFLTQNVSDHLSSSAYMSLASIFPVKKFSEERKDNPFMLRIESSSEVGAIDNNQNLPNSKLYSSPGMVFGKKKSYSTSKKVDQRDQERMKKEDQEVEEKEKQYWESLRRTYVQYCTPQSDHSDSVDWEAVRCAEVNKVAKAIEGRGQHNIMARRIQAFLNKLVEMHGSTDLEWLRHAPPNEVKEYLLKVYGLGLKSVECIRLLALKHVAFPVDVNVGRIAVRLGWVELEPLPESIQIHLLDQYPIIDMVQQYLWPRLCTLDQLTLYQLHYHLITFGKVFCTKKQPNCNACPMRAECKHFASAFASAKLALPGPVTSVDARQDNSLLRSEVPAKYFENQLLNGTPTTNLKKSEPIVEYPASPSPEDTKMDIDDIEDFYKNDDDSEEFITVKLNEESTKIADNYFDRNDMQNSKAVVALTANNASIPMPKLKNVSRLRTERLVYVLPDVHPLLVGLKMREDGDPSNYLLVIWTSGELKDPCESTQNQCGNSNNDIEEENSETVPGTLLIPCRTAMDGRFPLNGTYFQVNEVFADADSSQHPIDVPRRWLWHLKTRITYFGTSTSTILRGLSLEEIQECFLNGFVCVRGFDRKIGAPRPLSCRFHRNTADKQVKKKNTDK